jgi:hypothetical protein
MTAKQFRALECIAAENEAGRLAISWQLARRGVHPVTFTSILRRGWVEYHDPGTGLDGHRLTAAGVRALRMRRALVARRAGRRQSAKHA